MEEEGAGGEGVCVSEKWEKENEGKGFLFSPKLSNNYERRDLAGENLCRQEWSVRFLSIICVTPCSKRLCHSKRI